MMKLLKQSAWISDYFNSDSQVEFDLIQICVIWLRQLILLTGIIYTKAVQSIKPPFSVNIFLSFFQQPLLETSDKTDPFISKF